MPEFACDICFKVFYHKGKYNDHLRRLTPCGPLSEKIEKVLPNDLTCSVCFKEFANKSNRVKHETKTACALKIQDMKDEASQIKEEKSQIKIMAEKIEKLEQLVSKEKSIVNNTTTTSHSNNNTNSHNKTTNNNTNSHNKTTNNVTINVYGKENLSHITDNQYIQIMNRVFMCLKDYIVKKYFSDEMKENANVYSSDFKSRYLQVFDQASQWMLRDKKEIIDQMYNVNCEELASKYIDLQAEIKLKNPKFEKFMDECEDEEIRSAIHEDIKKTLFNERHKALKNIKEFKKSCC